MGGLGRHHQHPLAVAELPVDDADVGDDASVGVVDRVEDQGPGRRVRVADRRGQLADDLVEQGGDPVAGLGRHPQHLGRVAADDVGQLCGVLVGLGAGQVDLVEHRDDVQVGVQGQVEVGQGLCLDPLRGVDQQHRTLAGGQRARHLVGEVDVAGGVDHVEHVVHPGHFPGHPHSLGLDGDAAFALDVHPVEVLGAHGPGIDHAGELQHPVGQRRLAMVDVGDDAEVPDDLRGRTTRRGHGGRTHEVGLPGRTRSEVPHHPTPVRVDGPVAPRAASGRRHRRRPRHLSRTRVRR